MCKSQCSYTNNISAINEKKAAKQHCALYSIKESVQTIQIMATTWQELQNEGIKQVEEKVRLNVNCTIQP